MKVERIFNGMKAADSFCKLFELNVIADLYWRVKNDNIGIMFMLEDLNDGWKKLFKYRLNVPDGIITYGDEMVDANGYPVKVEFVHGWFCVETASPLVCTGIDVTVDEAGDSYRMYRVNKYGLPIRVRDEDKYRLHKGDKVRLIKDLFTKEVIGICTPQDIWYGCCEEEWSYDEEALFKVVNPNIKRLWTKQVYGVNEARSCKYYLSAVLLIKDENEYLNEWLRVNRKAGIEHFYIYDNNDESNAISNNDEDVTVIPFRGKHRQLQYECYEEWCKDYKTETTWVTFIDTDEMFTGDVVSFLRQNEKYCLINPVWTCHGACGLLDRTDTSDSFKDFPDVVENPNGLYSKPIVQTEYLQRPWVHNHMCHGNLLQLTNFEWHDFGHNEIQIHHFITRSLREYIDKLYRGSCDPMFLRRLDEFYDFNPDIDNDTVERYLKSNNIDRNLSQ